MALMEEYLPGRTENLHDYLIPSIGDVPEIRSILIEKPDPEGPFGAKGLGEHALIPTAPAILNAIRHATGARITPIAGLAAPRSRSHRSCGGRPMSTPKPEKIRCDACPVMCYIAEGKSGACDRYANEGGRIVRCDPLTILEQTRDGGGKLVPFLQEEEAWDGEIVPAAERFITAIGAGTTYPDYKPAPFIVSRAVEGADLVTVVTEAIFSYCGVKVKVDTDRHLGPEQATVRASGEPVGHVTTGEYGSQMLSLGGVRHLTGGSKAEGRVTCQTLLDLCNRKPVTLTIDEGSEVVVEAGAPPVVDGKAEARMRVGCGSATIGMFATQWKDKVDEGGGGRRPHHRRSLRASGRQGAGLAGYRDQHPRPPLHARPLFQGGRAWPRLGRGGH